MAAFSSIRIPRRLATVLIALAALRLILPWVALWSLNRALAGELTEYEGRVRDLRLHLLRGGYELQGFEIRRRNSLSPPLLIAARIRLVLSWSELLHGRVVASVHVHKAEVHFVSSRQRERSQYGTEERNWRSALRSVIPVSIVNLRISDSEAVLTDADLPVPLTVRAREIEASAEGLRTRRNPAAPFSRFHLGARLQDRCRLELAGAVDLLAEPPRGELSLQLVDFELSTLNRLLMAYMPLNVYHGRLSLYSEVAFSRRLAKGYLKAFLEDAKILAPEEEFVSTKQAVNEYAAGLANWLLMNAKSGRVAVYVPFTWHGRLPDPDTAEAFWSVLENRFDRLRPGLEHSVSLKELPP